jgi:hypothetical protein
MTAGYVLSQAVAAVTRLGIADLIKDSPRSAEDLAQACAVNADALYRTLRALASTGVFTETAPRTFANTPLSEVLRSDVPGSIRPMVLFIGDEMHWKVFGDFMHCLQTGKPAFDHVFGQPCWDYLVAHPQAAKGFDEAMTAHSTMGVNAVAEAYDFSGAHTVVDIAGGNGMLLRVILERNPNLRGVLFDMPHAIRNARNAGLVTADRCGFVEGDFFASVPEGGDVYILKHIIHDWDDQPARRILQTCRKAMQSGSRLLVIEHLVPPGNEPGMAKILDLEMLAIPGGRERTTDEMSSLLGSAGFRLERVVPTKSPLAIFEALPL